MSASLPASVPSWHSTWRTGSEFLARFTPGDPAKLYHPTQEAGDLPPGVEVGALVSVFLRFEDRQAEFHVHATVLEVHTTGAAPGVLLALVPEERTRLELVLTCVVGESVPYKRRRPRVTIALPVMVRALGRPARTLSATNVNEGGFFLAMDDVGGAPDVDSRITIEVTWPSKKTHVIKARVVEIIGQGPQRGFGVEFQFRSTEQRDDVANEVARLREALRS